MLWRHHGMNDTYKLMRTKKVVFSSVGFLDSILAMGRSSVTFEVFWYEEKMFFVRSQCRNLKSLLICPCKGR